MVKLKYFLLFLLCASTFDALAQLSVGSWRMHLAYTNTSLLAETPNRIFAVSDGALYSIGKEDFDIQTYDKISGLSDAGIVQIKYNETTEKLIIVYSNGNIDLLGAAGVINVPDLYIKQMTSAKTVNHIYCSGSLAYLSTEFGVLVLDTKKAEIKDSYYIGKNSTEVKALATTIFGGKIYVATADSVYSAALSANLVDYQFWTTSADFPGTGKFQSIASLGERLCIVREGILYYFHNNNWEMSDIHPGITRMNVSGNRLYIVWNDLAGYYDQNFAFHAANVYDNEKQTWMQIPDYLFSDDKHYFAAKENGMAVLAGTSTASLFKPEGPANNATWDLTFAGEKLFAVPGGRAAAQYKIAGTVSIYQDGHWKNITAKEIESKTGVQALDFINTAVDPADDTHFFVTSYGTGLYEFRGNGNGGSELYERWTQRNTNYGVEVHIAGGGNIDTYTRLAGAVFDSEGNLFLINAGATPPIRALSKNGEWVKLSTADRVERPRQTGINALYPNQKWMISDASPAGIIVIDDNGTLENTGDDKTILRTSFNYLKNKEITTMSNVACYCLAQDKTGVIWLGTANGPLLFNNTQNIFSSDYLCSKVLIPRNDNTDLGDFLLEDEAIKAIAIDGANRKWLGTANSGVYLVSANGLETIHHFTAENSPLPDNSLQTIAINPTTGEVFFGTPSGIASFQSDAVEPQEQFEKTTLRAFPNPVRENFEGTIAITGMVENSTVKITDVSGNLVYQAQSNGGLATWNGRDGAGNKVRQGVYVAMCVSADGTMHASTKILIFR